MWWCEAGVGAEGRAGTDAEGTGVEGGASAGAEVRHRAGPWCVRPREPIRMKSCGAYADKVGKEKK